ncbi:helix-turn-helix domain-containing protein [Priestia aryabhattai]|uniref:helix-turn-helix domain-containing protein n=1 Tax=Priestia aryabhattai TaxID=412384 RepID=UPI003CE8DC7B
MGFADRYAKHRSEQDPEFKKNWEDEKRKDQHELACKIISLRLELGLTQKDFGELVGLKQSYISRLENGEQNITYQLLKEIVRKAGADMDINISLKKSENELVSI